MSVSQDRPDVSFMRKEQRYRDWHTIRILASTVAALLVMVGVVKLWPHLGEQSLSDMIYATSGTEIIQFEEIVPTSQEARPPRPPSPLPPVIVPNDEILEEELVVDEEFLVLEDVGLVQKDELPGDPDTRQGTRMHADSLPKAVRIVEPRYTRAAQRKKIRAEVVVDVIIDKKGRVEESSIAEMYLLGGEDEPKQRVERLGYGLEESAIAAAQGWSFQPARAGGKPVRSQYSITLRFGV